MPPSERPLGISSFWQTRREPGSSCSLSFCRYCSSFSRFAPGELFHPASQSEKGRRNIGGITSNFSATMRSCSASWRNEGTSSCGRLGRSDKRHERAMLMPATAPVPSICAAPSTRFRQPGGRRFARTLDSKAPARRHPNSRSAAGNRTPARGENRRRRE